MRRSPARSVPIIRTLDATLCAVPLRQKPAGEERFTTAALLQAHAVLYAALHELTGARIECMTDMSNKATPRLSIYK
jgi:hypothetical protein